MWAGVLGLFIFCIYILICFKETVLGKKVPCGGCRLVYNGPRAAEVIIFISGVFCLFCFSLWNYSIFSASIFCILCGGGIYLIATFAMGIVIGVNALA